MFTPRCGFTAPVTVHLPLVGRSSTAIPRPAHHPQICGYSTSVSASVLQTEETGSIPVTRSRVATPKASHILSFVFCLRKVLSLPFFPSVGTPATLAQLVERSHRKRKVVGSKPTGSSTGLSPRSEKAFLRPARVGGCQTAHSNLLTSHSGRVPRFCTPVRRKPTRQFKSDSQLHAGLGICISLFSIWQGDRDTSLPNLSRQLGWFKRNFGTGSDDGSIPSRGTRAKALGIW